MTDSEILLQKFAYSVICRPLVYLMNVPKTANTTKECYCDYIRYTAKISVVFLIKFNIFKLLGYSINHANIIAFDSHSIQLFVHFVMKL